MRTKIEKLITRIQSNRIIRIQLLRKLSLLTIIFWSATTSASTNETVSTKTINRFTIKQDLKLDLRYNLINLNEKFSRPKKLESLLYPIQPFDASVFDDLKDFKYFNILSRETLIQKTNIKFQKKIPNQISFIPFKSR